jgi:hypothetical protein
MIQWLRWPVKLVALSVRKQTALTHLSFKEVICNSSLFIGMNTHVIFLILCFPLHIYVV